MQYMEQTSNTILTYWTTSINRSFVKVHEEYGDSLTAYKAVEKKYVNEFIDTVNKAKEAYKIESRKLDDLKLTIKNMKRALSNLKLNTSISNVIGTARYVMNFSAYNKAITDAHRKIASHYANVKAYTKLIEYMHTVYNQKEYEINNKKNSNRQIRNRLQQIELEIAKLKQERSELRAKVM